MNRRRVLALASRIAHQFRRDKRTLALLIVAPMVILALLGYIYRGDSGPAATIAIVSKGAGQGQEQSPLARQIIDGLKQDTAIQVKEMDAARADRAIERRDVDAVLTLPANLALQPGGFPQQLAITLEGSDPGASGAVLGALQRTIPQTVIRAVDPAGLPLRIAPRFLHGGPEYDSLDYFAPVLIAFFAFFFIFLLTSVSFLRERMSGSIERLMVSPLSRGEIVVGYMLGFTLFAALQAVIIVLFAVYVLRIHYAGNLGLVFLLMLLLVIGSVNMGIFLSTFARTELQVVQFVPLVIVPQGLLSGIIWPLASLPDPLRWLARALPLTYANEALRGVMIRGDALDALWLDIAVLTGFAVLMIALGTSTLRREAA